MKRPSLFHLILFTIIFGLFMISIFYFYSCSSDENNVFAKISWFQLSVEKEPNILFEQISESQKCIKSKNLMSQNILNVWVKIADMVNECTNDLFHTLNETTTIKKILVTDLELKYFILPFQHQNASCNVISLGIGGETESEERVKRLMPQCKFLGIDSGAALSKTFYEGQLGGTYVEGLVGAKNGTFTANVLEKGAYVVKELQHYSFTYFLSKYFKEDLIDLIFMDIEGDEYELMKDMIDNPNQYPPICQINVEFHDSSKKDQIMLPLFTKLFERSQYVAIKSGFFFAQINKFHLINVKNSECLKKYIIE